MDSGFAQIAGGAYKQSRADGAGLGDGFVLPERLGGLFASNQVAGADFTEALDIADCGRIVGSFAQTGEPSIPPLEGEIAACE